MTNEQKPVAPFATAYPAPWRIQQVEVVDRDGSYILDFNDHPDEREFWRGVVEAVNRPAAAEADGRLFDPDKPMADGEIRMTAAENVLDWLLIEKIGVVDDRAYSPNEAQTILSQRLDAAREMEIALVTLVFADHDRDDPTTSQAKGSE